MFSNPLHKFFNYTFFFLSDFFRIFCSGCSACAVFEHQIGDCGKWSMWIVLKVHNFSLYLVACERWNKMQFLLNLSCLALLLMFETQNILETWFQDEHLRKERHKNSINSHTGRLNDQNNCINFHYNYMKKIAMF